MGSDTKAWRGRGGQHQGGQCHKYACLPGREAPPGPGQSLTAWTGPVPESERVELAVLQVKSQADGPSCQPTHVATSLPGHRHPQGVSRGRQSLGP